MDFFDNVTYVNGINNSSVRGLNEMFVASIVKRKFLNFRTFSGHKTTQTR